MTLARKRKLRLLGISPPLAPSAFRPSYGAFTDGEFTPAQQHQKQQGEVSSAGVETTLHGDSGTPYARRCVI